MPQTKLKNKDSYLHKGIKKRNKTKRKQSKTWIRNWTKPKVLIKYNLGLKIGYKQLKKYL